MKQPNVPIMTNVSMGASANSIAIPLEQEQLVSVQAVWSGAPVGDFTIETACDVGAFDPSGQPTGITNWNTYTGSSQAAGGSSGVFTWRIRSIPDRWLRLKYTRTSGTGTVNARTNEKGD